jgi:hypothetical protein
MSEHLNLSERFERMRILRMELRAYIDRLRLNAEERAALERLRDERAAALAELEAKK